MQQSQRTKWVTVCPREMRATIIREIHTQHHAGIQRTYQRILTQWYWPGMHAAVRQAVKQCEVCQMAKNSRTAPIFHQQRLHSGRPWQVLAVDLVGPFLETPRGNRMVLVLTDHFTRWKDAIAVPDGASETVARVLDSQIFAYFRRLSSARCVRWPRTAVPLPSFTSSVYIAGGPGRCWPSIWWGHS